jgi:drug/metabolite transporter (DMT)-like permease
MITTTSFFLVLASAAVHPLWNMLLKASEDKVIFYVNLHLIFTVLFSFLLLIYPVGDIDASGWLFLGLSSVAHFFYQVFLCKTYEAGDMSLTYPIARSSPLFVLVIGSIALQETPSPAAITGILLVVLGIYLMSLRSMSFSEFVRPLRIAHREALLFALATALFSAAYSVVDKKGALNMQPALFFYLFIAISGLMFLGYLLLLNDRRGNYWRILKRDKYRITLASVLQFGSYVLILYAFRYSNVAYVVALRQVSVVFGVLYGTLFLKERNGRGRLLASTIIFLGSFLIVVYG